MKIIRLYLMGTIPHMMYTKGKKEHKLYSRWLEKQKTMVMLEFKKQGLQLPTSPIHKIRKLEIQYRDLRNNENIGHHTRSEPIKHLLLECGILSNIKPWKLGEVSLRLMPPDSRKFRLRGSYGKYDTRITLFVDDEADDNKGVDFSQYPTLVF